MKRIYNRYVSALLMSLLFLSGCIEEINHPSEGSVPLATEIDVEITVDQEINQVTFTLKNQGSYPIWTITEGDKITRSTENGFKKIFANAGEYSVEVKIGNANGVSDGSITEMLTINNSLVDFASYIARVAGTEESKTWSIAKQEAAHLACGEPGSIGTNYYAAAPNEKAAFGLYDDVLTFGIDESYTYNPGVGGTVYVNKGSTLFAEHNPNNDADFTAPVSEQTTTYEFIVEGNDVFLTFPAQTLFPYIANDDAYNTPKYRVVSLTPTKMELVIDNGEIAWHYILASGSAAGPGGYNPDHECNLWTDATFTTGFWYAPNWSQIADPTFEQSGNQYKVTLTQATFAQWQAQMFFETDLSTEAGKMYDFSAVFNSSKDHGNVTVKLVHETNDAVYYFEEGIQLNAYEDFAFVKTGMDGIDLQNIRLFLDFGGNEAETEVVISRIVLKENSCDDGTVIEEEEDNVNWLPDSDCNLWKNVSYTNFFYYAPGWAQIADPAMTVDGNSYTLTFPTATSAQWQAQAHFRTSNIATAADKTYDFRCILNSSKDLNGATIKLTKVGDDATAFFTQRVNLTAFEDFVFKMPAMPGVDIDNISLVFDFGGNADNTEVTISSIILKESTCND